MKSLAALKLAVRRVQLERYVVDRPITEQGNYQFQLSGDFPLAVKRIYFCRDGPKPPLTWHAYQEVFVLLSGACRLQMGDSRFDLAAGDVLAMDHLKLHAVVDFRSPRIESLVIRFLPEIVHSAGSVRSDHLILLPFFCQIEERPHILPAGHRDAAVVHEALAKLVGCYADLEASPYAQAGSRVYFLELLYHLSRHFRAAEQLQQRFVQQQTQAGRLRAVFAHINARYADRISLADMAAKADLSRAQFYRLFKKAAGMTLVDYVAQIRLSHAARLLHDSSSTIAEIANATGFTDQSYFDRRFRRYYGQTPLQFRNAHAHVRSRS